MAQTMKHCCDYTADAECEKTHCELDLASSHDVIQEGIHFDDLSGGMSKTEHEL